MPERIEFTNTKMIMHETGYLTKENGTWNHFHYFIKDHLGNNRLVVNQSGAIVQSLQYEPFGMTFADGINAGWQPYKFGGKEEETDCRLNWYDFESRLYVPDLGRFMQPDPMAEKYYSISPYAYCGNNPINRIDPDGRDDYEINSRGKVVNRIENTERDAFFMVDKKGNRIEGKELSFGYGTVENFKSQYSDEAKTTFDWYNVRGDDNGKQLFEFFANNTTVEWSQLQLGQKGENGLNIVSTSHEKSTERSVNFLLDNQYKFGYTIRGHNHNHPSNTAFPSGLDTRGSDIGFSNKLTNISLKNGSGIPTFKIYLPKTGKYINYDRNSTYSNFPAALPSFTLPEITIKPRK